jgi:hypothetical protein
MAAKKSSKPGAVKYFNDLKAKGYKDAANAMNAFRKKMPKAQLGDEVNNMLVNKPGSGAKKSSSDNEYSNIRNIGFSAKETYDIMKSKRTTDGMSEDEKMYRGLGPAKKGGAIKTKKKK